MRLIKEIDRSNVHIIDLKELFASLDTSHQGLSSSQVAELRTIFGANKLSEQKKEPAIIRFGRNLTNKFALLLWVGAILSFIGEYFQPGEGTLYIGLALVVVVFINAFFTYWQEAKAENAMAAFKKMLGSKTIVFREGREKIIGAEELVPGDIIILKEGDKVPADARLIEVNGLKVNNAPLTGESEPQLRSLEPTAKDYLDSRNLIFSGTLVSSGSGKAVVFATGDNTEIGRIARVTLEAGSVESPMQKEIKHFSKIISRIAISLGLLFFIVGWALGNPFWANLIFAIGIIVSNVPEGLLPTVTLALSIAASKMASKNALIKRLNSVETLGSTTVICTDKTGTLTLNDMRVTNLFLNLKNFSNNKVTTEDIVIDWTDNKGNTPSKKALNRAVLASALCNNAVIHRDGTFEVIGDPTETALLLFADQQKVGPNIDWMRQDWPRKLEIPFSSKTKEMITVHAGKKHGQEVAYLKGAPEVVIKHCNKIIVDDSIKSLSKRHKELIKAQTKRYTNDGKRVLALAYKYIPPEKNISLEAKKEDYIMVGLVAMYDPLRPEVKGAVAKCVSAGIKIIVVSGDHPLTVRAIARMAGIVKNPLLVTGDELSIMSHSKIKEIVRSKEVIFARVAPQDKMRIVRALQELDEVVAVTGDGVNDAPALKQADIGVAMGVSGTDVAKEAADMVLMDDNFKTIVSAVEEGRLVYSNIRKFVAYILTSNVPEILPFIAYVLLSIPLPLSVMLILSIDLGTDLLPALGLATESSESDLMKDPPRDRNERLMSKKLLFMSYGIIGMIQAAAGFSAYFAVLLSGGWKWGDTLTKTDPLYQMATGAFFISIVIAQVADVMICRTRKDSILNKGLLSNKLVIAGILFELAVAWTITSTNIGNTIFNTHPLPFWAWLIPVPFALIILLGDELRKFLLRRGSQFINKYLSW